MSGEQKFRMVDEDKIPIKLSRKREQWLEILRNIPRGKALIATEKELGVSASSVRSEA